MALEQEPKPTKTCSYCGESILEVAVKCRHCGSNLAQKERLDKAGKVTRSAMAGGMGLATKVLKNKVVVAILVAVTIIGGIGWSKLPTIVDVWQLSRLEYMTVSDFPDVDGVTIDVPKGSQRRTLDSGTGFDVVVWDFETRNPLGNKLLSFISVTVRPRGVSYWMSYLQREGTTYETLNETHGDNKFIRLKAVMADYYFVDLPSTYYMVKLEGMPDSDMSRSAYEAVIDRILSSVRSP